VGISGYSVEELELVIAEGLAVCPNQQRVSFKLIVVVLTHHLPVLVQQIIRFKVHHLIVRPAILLPELPREDRSRRGEVSKGFIVLVEIINRVEKIVELVQIWVVKMRWNFKKDFQVCTERGRGGRRSGNNKKQGAP